MSDILYPRAAFLLTYSPGCGPKEAMREFHRGEQYFQSALFEFSHLLNG